MWWFSSPKKKGKKKASRKKAAIPEGAKGERERLQEKFTATIEQGQPLDEDEVKLYNQLMGKASSAPRLQNQEPAKGKMLYSEREQKAYEDAKEIYRPTTATRKTTTTTTPKRGKPFDEESEEREVEDDGSGTSTTKTSILVAACGKRITKEEIVGYCDVCEEAVCPEHNYRCQGYEENPCNKPLCAKHVYFFEEEDGTKIPCCPEHYKMRYFYQKKPFFGMKPKKKEKEDGE
jgi:hypothetical protein